MKDTDRSTVVRNSENGSRAENVTSGLESVRDADGDVDQNRL